MSKIIRAENLKSFFVGRERIRHVEAFLDEGGNSRVLIDGKVQPVRYSYQARMRPSESKEADWSQFKYIDMRKGGA